MKRSILSAFAAFLLVLSALTTADAAERKKPSWLSSCPEVADATPQLSTPMTKFLKSPSGQKFQLLAKDSVEFVTEPKSIIGCYVFEESITNPSLNPSWQIGALNRDLQGYYFKNQAGVIWRLTLNSKTMILETAPGSTYYSQGGGFALDAAPEVVTSPTAKAVAAVPTAKVGLSCPKIGQGQQVGTKVLICAKKGGKNLWRDATAAERKAFLTIKTPRPAVTPSLKPSVTPTPTPTPTVSPITSTTTGLSGIRASAIANNTFYLDRGNCHSRGINAELQALENGTWKRLVGAMGWDDASNCDAAHPVQPWTAIDVPAGTTLRWRFWLTGLFDLNSATFLSLAKGVQPSNPTVKPTPTATAVPTVKPPTVPTPTATAVPTVRPSATPTPTATAVPTVRPSATPTPTATAVPTVKPPTVPTPTVTAVPTVRPSATPTPTSSLAPVPTVTPNPTQSISATQVPLFISNTNLKFIVGNSTVIETSGGMGNGALTFSVTGPNCSISGNLLAASAVTICAVTATKASSNGIGITISQPVSFEFIAQPLVLGFTTPNGLVGQTIYLSYSGGSGTGRVTYISNGTGNCSVWDENGLTNGPSKLYIRSTIPGACTVTAQKAASPGFPLAQSEPVTFSFGTVNQPPLIITSIPSTIIKVGDSFKLSASSASNEVKYGVSFSVEGTGCSIRTEKVTLGGIISTVWYVTSTNSTNCNVTATNVSLGYNPQTSSPVSFPFGFYNQQPFSISSASTASEGSLVSINSTGGSGTGAVTFAATGPNCSISGSNVTASAPTTCVVTGTKASKDGFSAITSQPITIVFQKVDLADQAPLKIEGNFRLRAGELFLGSVSGGSGTGAVTYSVTGQNCYVPTSGGQAQIMVAASDGAECEITVKKAGSIGYKPAQYSTFMSFRVDDQAAIYINQSYTNSPFGICSGCGNWLGITGGSGKGPVTYEVSGANCSISGTSYLMATAETTCTVRATKAASVGYKAVTSSPVSFNFKIFSQGKLTISNSGLIVKMPSTFTLGTFGGTGSGAVTYSTNSIGCFISGNILSVTVTNTAVTCVVTATKAASLGYFSISSDPISFRFDPP